MIASQQKEPLRFFIYVVESPSAADLYHQRAESGVLQQAASLNRIPCVARCAISAMAFEAALRIGLPETMAVYPEHLPILHISCHGNAQGVGFSNGESLQWHELRQLLRPINKSLNGTLIVCISSCQSYAGSRMAMHPDDPDYPFLALIGNSGQPAWPDTAIAFATLYHLLARGEQIHPAVLAMRMASGNKEFFLTTAEKARADYVSYLASVNLERAQRELQQAAHDQPLLDEENQRELESGSS